MTKYTIQQFIEFLSRFPEDLEITNDIAFTWNFPVELKKQQENMSEEEYFDLTIKNATELFVLEGDWDKGTVEAFNNMFKNKWGKNKRKKINNGKKIN